MLTFSILHAGRALGGGGVAYKYFSMSQILYMLQFVELWDQGEAHICVKQSQSVTS